MTEYIVTIIAIIGTLEFFISLDCESIDEYFKLNSKCLINLGRCRYFIIKYKNLKYYMNKKYEEWDKPRKLQNSMQISIPALIFQIINHIICIYIFVISFLISNKVVKSTEFNAFILYPAMVWFIVMTIIVAIFVLLTDIKVHKMFPLYNKKNKGQEQDKE